MLHFGHVDIHVIDVSNGTVGTIDSCLVTSLGKKILGREQKISEKIIQMTCYSTTCELKCSYNGNT